MRSGELAYTPHLLHSLILYAISYVPCYMLTYLKCFLSRVLWIYLPLPRKRKFDSMLTQQFNGVRLHLTWTSYSRLLDVNI